MPRKSASSLEVVVTDVTAVTVRLAAPDHINEAERAVWLQLVNDLPAAAFSESHAPLIELYCRHIVNARMMADEAAQFDRAWLADPEGLKRYDRLLSIAEREGRAASALATRLRITRQAIHPRTAGRLIANAPKGRKPWEPK